MSNTHVSTVTSDYFNYGLKALANCFDIDMYVKDIKGNFVPYIPVDEK